MDLDAFGLPSEHPWPRPTTGPSIDHVCGLDWSLALRSTGRPEDVPGRKLKGFIVLFDLRLPYRRLRNANNLTRSVIWIIEIPIARMQVSEPLEGGIEEEKLDLPHGE